MCVHLLVLLLPISPVLFCRPTFFRVHSLLLSLLASELLRNVLITHCYLGALFLIPLASV
jgi:hypothetical protein